tara:strand:- start:304 stop:774 length:471 start_codon:yes stop_codon:yes gene_type:complete
MVNELIDNSEKDPNATGFRDNWDEAPTTVTKLTNPSELSGDGFNSPAQISDALTLTQSVEKNFYAGNLTYQTQYGVKLFMIKEFERKKMLDIPLDSKMFGLYSTLDTMGAKMSLLELQTSNSIDAHHQDSFIDALTNGARRVFSKFKKSPDEENLK